MIKTEMIGNRIHTYSDAGMMIRQIDVRTWDSEVGGDVPGRHTYGWR